MTDPVQLLRAANPVRDCDPPEFDRLLERLQHEPSDPSAGEIGPTRGRFAPLRRTKVPSITGGWRALAVLVPAAVAVAVAAAAIVSLHGGGPRPAGPAHTTTSSGSLAYPPGQAQGRVVPGSMRQFNVAAAGAHNATFGAEWFRTSAGQICVQAGRQVDGQIGYVDIDGAFPHDGRFRAWAPDTAVDARCVDPPGRGGITLTVVERVANSGYPLPPNGACTAAEHVPCPASDTTTIYYGLVGSGAVFVGYGSPHHGRSETLPTDGGADGEYITTPANGGLSFQCVGAGSCPATPIPPQKLVHPGARAFVLYTGASRSCTMRGPGTDGVMAGRCRYGLTIGPSPDRLTAAQVRSPVTVTTKTIHHHVQVTARFRSRVASTRIGEYELRLSTPDRCPPSAGVTSGSLPTGSFRAGQPLALRGTVSTPCAGTYHGSVIAQPLVGTQLTVGRFSFKEHRGP